MSKERVTIAVRSLVEFVLAGGDITPIGPSAQRFQDGIKGHQLLQTDRGPDYQAEVPLTLEVEGQTVTLVVSGKADGVDRGSDPVAVEEIKTTDGLLADLTEESFPSHWAQAEVYAAILADQDDLETVDIHLIYYQLRSGEQRVFSRRRDRGELRDFLEFLTQVYLDWCESLSLWTAQRAQSLSTLSFPFPEFRVGQREMTVAVYRAMNQAGELFVQAPTGIGKTISVLFASIKALHQGRLEKIFYLTAKNTTQAVAEESLELLRQTGMRLKTVTITAKGRICFLKEDYPNRPPCDPAVCRYARGYYKKVKTALHELESHDAFTRPLIEELAESHEICPFEYSLDLANWADLVIGDYNYAFDPRVQLARFFVLRKGNYGILVDEAHNLPDRAREMFSAELDKGEVLAVRRGIKETHPALAKAVSALNKELLALRKEVLPEKNQARPEPPYELGERAREFVAACERGFRHSRGRARSFPEALMELYYRALAFVRVLADFDERFVTLLEIRRGGLRVKLACIDPSQLLRKTMKRGKTTVFFSATLTPMQYHVDLLGGSEESGSLVLPSPFPRENLCLIIDPSVSTRYRDRPTSYDGLAQRILTLARVHRGNYMSYFPSYAYMGAVLARFSLLADPGIRILVQKPGMTEEERRAFLSEFRDDGLEQTLVAFAVMGGIFAEGVDLVGDRLAGVIVVGVGLPGISPDRDLIRAYYDRIDEKGFRYAYMYPGLSRVLQAAGRVIRTETDRGVVLLIDDRFSHGDYREVLPLDWRPVPFLSGPDLLAERLEEFWGDDQISVGSPSFRHI